jgi:hypothetical protein
MSRQIATAISELIQTSGPSANLTVLACNTTRDYRTYTTKRLIFNYRTKFSEIWEDPGLMEQHQYSVKYGDGTTPVTVDLLS